MALLTPSRRGFLFGASAFLAAPAIVRVASIMPVSVPKVTNLSIAEMQEQTIRWIADMQTNWWRQAMDAELGWTQIAETSDGRYIAA